MILTTPCTVFFQAPLVCDFLFELLCGLKYLKPFSKILADFSVKVRYQDPRAGTSKVLPSKFELSVSNNTIEESVGSYKPTT